MYMLCSQSRENSKAVYSARICFTQAQTLQKPDFRLSSATARSFTISISRTSIYFCKSLADGESIPFCSMSLYFAIIACLCRILARLGSCASRWACSFSQSDRTSSLRSTAAPIESDLLDEPGAAIRPRTKSILLISDGRDRVFALSGENAVDGPALGDVCWD